MSVDNLTMLHTAAFAPFAATTPSQLEKPKLAMMLPDPTRHSPQQQGPVSPSSTCSTNSQGFYEHRPQMHHSKSFSLPPIRELLKNTPPASTRSSASSASSSCSSSLPTNPTTMAQPAPRPIPFIHQIPSPQYQPFQLNSITPPPQQKQPHSQPLGRSSSLPNYLTNYGGRVPSPSIQYQLQPQPQPHLQQIQAQYGGVHHVHTPNMVSTPESRSESASPVHGEMISMPVYGEANKESKLSSRKKRQNLPRQTTLILLSWLSEHLDRPYPNSREKYELLMKTRLTIQQLDNWFINARRRKINELRKLKENDQSIALMF